MNTNVLTYSSTCLTIASIVRMISFVNPESVLWIITNHKQNSIHPGHHHSEQATSGICMVWQNTQCMVLQAICSSLAAIINESVMTTNKSLHYSLLLTYPTLAHHFMLSLRHFSLSSDHALSFQISCLADGCTPGNFSLYAAITCGDLLFSSIGSQQKTSPLFCKFSIHIWMIWRQELCVQSNDITVYTNKSWHNHSVANCCKQQPGHKWI
jgi:hypothetical protein